MPPSPSGRPPRRASRARRAVLFLPVLAGAAVWLAAPHRAGQAAPSRTDLARTPVAGLEVQGADSLVSSRDIGRPISAGTVDGITMFRGNASRTFYGQGPLPRHPVVLWRYPERAMCSESSAKGVTKVWCGTGWTGQPVVVEDKRGLEVIVGAFDGQVHFIDGITGKARRQPFATKDLVKGSVTLDPDGFPLLYTGSRDNFYRVIALDREPVQELWRISAADAPRPLWNNDWDGNGIVHKDHLFVGGENGWFYVARLNRGYDANGKVRVQPRILARIAGFDDPFLKALGDHEVSIESSASIFGNTAYFANSGGLVSGVPLDSILAGSPKPVEPTFRFWTGDDSDASIVVDEEGNLYVASEMQRYNARAAEVGQFMKLNPRLKNPLVWSIKLPVKGGMSPDDNGIWSTPALFGHTLFVTTNAGQLMAVNRDDGTTRWTLPLPPHAWSSPLVIDSTLVVADCGGSIRAWDVRDPSVRPPLLWTVKLPGGSCIESTIAAWKGRLYVGARNGFIYAIGDQ